MDQRQIDEKFMRLALNEARKAFDMQEVPIGAVVVSDDPKRGFRRYSERVFHPKTEVASGVLAGECEALMTSFFASLRN